MVLVLVNLACGCGDTTLSAPATQLVKGRVIKNGEPLALEAEERLEITFFPDQKSGLPPGLMFTGVTQSDGTFEVAGPRGMGIPRGKYRIAVALLTVDANGKVSDKFQEAFSPANAPFEQEVMEYVDVVLDVGKAPQK
jgi:hypothetical protein